MAVYMYVCSTYFKWIQTMDAELTTLGSLENVNATVTRINADLLDAIKK